MKQIAILLAGASLVTLSACGAGSQPPTTMGSVVVRAGAGLDRVETEWAGIKAMAELIAPLLPPRQLAQLRAGEAAVETALLMARHATSVAEQAAAVREAERAAKAVAAFTPAPG